MKPSFVQDRSLRSSASLLPLTSDTRNVPVRQRAGTRQASNKALCHLSAQGSQDRRAQGRLLLRPQHQARPGRVLSAVNGDTTPGLDMAGPVMVWFKADLRVDDHEGLDAAIRAVSRIPSSSGAARVLPLFVLDPIQLQHLAFVPSGPAVLAGALNELRAALRQRGSDLIVAEGRWQDTVLQVAQEHGVRSIVVQEEVEHRSSAAASEVAQRCAASGISVTWWSAHTWQPTAFKHNYRQWRAGRPAMTAPIAAPETLPPLPESVKQPGSLPDASKLAALLASLRTSSGTAAGGGGQLMQEVQQVLADASSGPDAVRQQQLVAAGRDWLQRLEAYLSLSGAGAAGGGATGRLSEVLAEGMRAKESPAAEGYSFPAMFATALSLGALSRRRVYATAASLSPSQDPATASSLNVRAAAITAESGDFHFQLAARNDMRPPGLHPSIQQRHWRWNGFLTDYCIAEPPPGRERPGAPALLLVHGFGAFGDQWRDNMEMLAAEGYRVYAPTLPGFGRSEKSAVPYSQVLWSNFLRDFVVQVVGNQVVVAGNSIGGFISTNMAAAHPTLVSGLVLVNAAGPIVASGFSDEVWQKQAAARKPPPKWLVKAISGALFWYLERTVPRTLAWLYPTNPDRTKGWLSEEILRASADVGAIDVFASVFYLPPPRPLNWLINERYQGPTLVLQGVLDPLNDAKGRARDLATLCPQHVVVSELQAGHCPHDEAPEEFNTALLRWVDTALMQRKQVTAKQSTSVVNTA